MRLILQAIDKSLINKMILLDQAFLIKHDVAPSGRLECAIGLQVQEAEAW